MSTREQLLREFVRLLEQDMGQFLKWKDVREQLCAILVQLFPTPRELRLQENTKQIKDMIANYFSRNDKTILKDFEDYKGKHRTSLTSEEQMAKDELAAKRKIITNNVGRYFNQLAEMTYGEQVWMESNPKYKPPEVIAEQPLPPPSALRSSAPSSVPTASISISPTMPPTPSTPAPALHKVEKKPSSEKPKKPTQVAGGGETNKSLPPVPFQSPNMLDYNTEILPEDYRADEFSNEGYDKHHLKVPFRYLICAPSNAGKTAFLYNYIYLMQTQNYTTFDNIKIVSPTCDQDIYLRIADVFTNVEFIMDINNIPAADSFDKSSPTLFIFDDLIAVTTNKLAQKVRDFYARGRHYGISSFYLSQAFFETDIFIRANATHYALLGMSERDADDISKKYIFDVSREGMKKMYEYCASTPTTTGAVGYVPLVIHLREKRDRKYWAGLSLNPLNPDDFDPSEPRTTTATGRLQLGELIFDLPQGVTIETRAFQETPAQSTVSWVALRDASLNFISYWWQYRGL